MPESEPPDLTPEIVVACWRSGRGTGLGTGCGRYFVGSASVLSTVQYIGSNKRTTGGTNHETLHGCSVCTACTDARTIPHVRDDRARTHAALRRPEDTERTRKGQSGRTRRRRRRRALGRLSTTSAPQCITAHVSGFRNTPIRSTHSAHKCTVYTHTRTQTTIVLLTAKLNGNFDVFLFTSFRVACDSKRNENLLTC